MNLKNLNKLELDQRIKSLASQERALLHDILLTIKEIDQRRLYLELGFPNIFAYLVEDVGYSGGSAQRRIDAARLLSEVPSLGKKIQSGEVKLNQVSLIQKAAREVFKTTNKNVTADEKKEILENISNKTFEASQKEVASYFDIPVIEATTKKIQVDDSVRVSLTLSKELADKIQQAQELLSHALGTNDLVTYLEYLTDKVIKQKTATRNFKNTEVKSEFKPKACAESKTKPESTATVAVNHAKQPIAKADFSSRTKKLILKQQQSCQHKDPNSGKQCGSRWFLQIDHKQSRWAGGNNILQNAQVLCAQHNNLKYRQEAGIQLVSR